MGKLFWQINMSLDGFMEAPGGDLKQTAEIADDDYQRYASEMLETVDAFVIGRKTYDVFVNYWPTAEGRDAEILNSLPKIVASRTLQNPTWNNARVVNENLPAELERLKSDSKRDVAIFGSSDLAASIAKLGLIDEYRVFVTPYLIRSGTPAFADGFPHGELRLHRSEKWSSGTMALFYETLPQK